MSQMPQASTSDGKGGKAVDLASDDGLNSLFPAATQAAIDQLSLIFPAIDPQFAHQVLRRPEGRQLPLAQRLEHAVEYIATLKEGYRTVVTASPSKCVTPKRKREKTVQRVADPDETEDECCCCSTEYAVSLLIKCASNHPACEDCTRQHVETRLGKRIIDFPCMSQDDCKSQYPQSEIEKILDDTSLDLLERIQLDQSIGAAKLDGLTACPFCDYAAIIDDESQRVFECLNDICGKQSCIKCKKESHIPRTCKEVEDDAKAHSLHRVHSAHFY